MSWALEGWKKRGGGRNWTGRKASGESRGLKCQVAEADFLWQAEGPAQAGAMQRGDGHWQEA